MSFFSLMGSLIRKNFYLIFISLFLLSRVYVLAHPPASYSDVTQYHEKYANAWYYGLPPYLKFPFEYGPAAALLIFVPLVADQNGIGKYYFDYRCVMFAFDFLLFIVLLKSHQKLKVGSYLGLLLYLGITTLGKDWLYEGIDMAFVSVAMLCLYSYLLTPKLGTFTSWVAYWLSTAIKFLTIPLAWPVYLLNRQTFLKSVFVAAAAFLIVWGIPLAIFRSSLSVPFVLNTSRTVKYNTITDTIIRTINNQTHTEVRSQLPPDFSWEGPVSKSARKVVDILYPLSLLVVMLWSAVLIFKAEKPKVGVTLPALIQQFFQPSELTQPQKYQLLTKIYLVYFLVSFITAKIYSNPFLFWILPMLIIYQWQNQVKKYTYFALTFIWGVMELTPFFSARTLGLYDLAGFNNELYEVSLGWFRWAMVAAILVLVLMDRARKNFVVAK